MDRPLKIAILTCSDTRTSAEDTAGRALMALVEERGWTVADYRIVPDEADAIADALVEMADTGGVDVILTCGGTGFSSRDVTPEVTARVCERAVPGIPEHIRAESLKITKRAMLSRGAAGIRGRSLVVNLPGSEKAARESLGFVIDQLEHAVEMMAGGGH